MSAPTSPNASGHRSVLATAAVEYLVTAPDGIYVDATFGRGGHSRLILSRLSGSGRLVALDREALLLNAGGTYAGEFADGVVKPNIGIDYAPTGLWDGLLGQPVPGTGDPEFAKKLLSEGKDCPTEITLDYAQSEDSDKAAAIWVESLARAGITVKPNPIERGQYYGVVFENGNEIMTGGWGADWPNASTVLPPLFVQGWNLSRVDDKAFNDEVAAASVELDRNTQATMWHELSKKAAEQMWVVPTRFGRDQRLAGTKVGPIFSWSAYGSYPYPIMYAVQ